MKRLLPTSKLMHMRTPLAIAAAVVAAVVSASAANAGEDPQPALPDASVLNATLRANAVAEAQAFRKTPRKTSPIGNKTKPKPGEVNRSFSGYVYGSYYTGCTRILVPPDAEIQSCGIAGRYTDGNWTWAFLVTEYQLCSFSQVIAGYPSGCGPVYRRTVDWWYWSSYYQNWIPTTSPM